MLLQPVFSSAAETAFSRYSVSASSANKAARWTPQGISTDSSAANPVPTTSAFAAMPASDSPTLLVARFLKSQGYTNTLAAFVKETNIDESTIDDPTALTIEKVLDEKRIFDLSLQLEKTEIIEDDISFTEPYPSVPTEITSPEVTPANVLFVAVERFSQPFDSPLAIVTTADRALRLYCAQPPFTLLRNFPSLSDSPIHCATVISDKWILYSNMTGHLTLISADTGDVISSIKPYTKWAVRVISSGQYVASASYDKTVCVHELSFNSSGTPALSDRPLGTLQLQTAPEALSFVTLPESGEEALVLSRRDSTYLSYHYLRPALPLHAKRNLAPESKSWASYHAMSIALHPKNPKLLGIVTSSIPHMKFMLIEVDSEKVIKEVFTGAPQSTYSTAVMCWRPDGSGAWVNSDDGMVRGVAVQTGKVKASLKVCERGEKVRTLWAGIVDDIGEVVITGGFDKKLKIWRTP